MIKAEHLFYEFPEKELYKDITFTLEDQCHCAFIGTNGTGKSTLINIIRQPEDFMYDGTLDIQENIRIGYVSQFSQLDARSEKTVFEYMSEPFAKVQKEIEEICTQMETAEDIDSLMEQYQQQIDTFTAMEGDQFESTIRKQLKLAGLGKYENSPITNLSSGEYKLVQIITEMIAIPHLLIMDEPDGFLDFEHQNALKDLINEYQGTLLVVTHNRYLLNHCFDKILHLEDQQIQEFDGNYVEYNFALLQKKIELQELAVKDELEIERQKKIVDKLRSEALVIDKPSKGRALHARVSLVERLEANKIKAPFVEMKQPQIAFPVVEEQEEKELVLSVDDYSVSFEELLLEHVTFDIQAGDKVAIIGENGVGKTTLLRDIYKNESASITVGEQVKLAFLSQQQDETMNESNTIADEFYDLGLHTLDERKAFLEPYGFEETIYDRKIGELSGGEKNMLQLAKIAKSEASLLLLDEPTSHLDIYSQLALEEAIKEYKGAILMVSHDFYTVADCMDYVLYIDEKSIRKVSARKFRKMIYAKHFDVDYLQNEQQKKELEVKITKALKEKDFKTAGELSESLEKVIERM